MKPFKGPKGEQMIIVAGVDVDVSDVPETRPQRLQRKRTKGYRLPEGTVCVTRGTKWGNHIKVATPKEIKQAGYLGFMLPRDREQVVIAYRIWLEETQWGRALAEAAKRELRGKNLACFCPLPKDGEPDMCHAAILLELSNA